MSLFSSSLFVDDAGNLLLSSHSNRLWREVLEDPTSHDSLTSFQVALGIWVEDHHRLARLFFLNGKY